ncbi:MAG TPA: DNRLRE domain-containing protein [Gaiellaceae bacterium]|nr:DNRLRE domain-containing protein [Gaiellaceae bacterium]
MRALLLLLLLSALWAGPAGAESRTVSLPAVADLGLPFWCDWGYEWEERCFRDDGPRLPVGGAEDKVWRAALRFSLAGLPAEADVHSARLLVRHDGRCIARRLASVPCGELGYVLDAHRILSPSWSVEREVEMDSGVVDTAVVFAGWAPQWLSWDVTALARAWHGNLVPNNGLLLKLQDGDEELGYGGPYFVSSSHPDAATRPRLSVTYTAGG